MRRRAFLLVLSLLLIAAVAMAGSTKESSKPVTVEFWIFANYTVGKPLELVNTFVEEFQKANPSITVEVVGKPAPDIVSGLIAGAASGELPDVVTTQLGQGGHLLKAGVLKDISAYWSKMPQDWRSQFDANIMKILTQGGKIYGLPSTAYATALYRNRTVLRQAGIDPDAGIADWNDWLAQMKKIKDSGAFASGKVTGSWPTLNFYGGVPGSQNGLSADGKSTLLDATKLAQTFEFLLKAQAYNTDANVYDQASTDLFLTNKLAFIPNGAWFAPSLDEAKAKTGLDYDVVPIPGLTKDKKGGVSGGEFVAVIDGPDSDAAWKWAAFFSDYPQMKRFSMELAQFVANDKVNADPEVARNPIIQVTAKAFKDAVAEGPLFVVTPAQFYQSFEDASSLVMQGKEDAKTAAARAVDGINAALRQ